MARETGTVWYNRKPKQENLKTLFGNVATTQKHMELWLGDIGPIRGYLVRKVGQKQSALATYRTVQYHPLLRPQQGRGIIVRKVGQKRYRRPKLQRHRTQMKRI